MSAVAFSLEYASQGFSTDAVPPIVEFESVSLSSVAATARFYPIDRGVILPFAGIGYGRSTLKGKWTGPNYDVTRYRCFGACEDQYEEKFFAAMHPHYVAGLEVRVKPSTSLLFEYRIDVGRGDGFYALDGSGLSAGLRWRLASGR